MRSVKLACETAEWVESKLNDSEESIKAINAAVHFAELYIEVNKTDIDVMPSFKQVLIFYASLNILYMIHVIINYP